MYSLPKPSAWITALRASAHRKPSCRFKTCRRPTRPVSSRAEAHLSPEGAAVRPARVVLEEGLALKSLKCFLQSRDFSSAPCHFFLVGLSLPHAFLLQLGEVLNNCDVLLLHRGAVTGSLPHAFLLQLG